MPEYQNLFTRVQVRGPTPYPGVPLPRGDVPREGGSRLVRLFG